jgi:uncharacterized membrane protein HdeD (DUF308 family)
LPDAVTDAVTPWYVPLARAVPAIVLAAVVTFSADHSSSLGLATFGAFGVIAGAIVTAWALRIRSDSVARSVGVAQGLITVVAGIAALAAIGGGLPYLVFVVSAFGAATGLLELYLGLRYRRRDRSARDWTFVGATTAVLSIAVLLVPPELQFSFVGDNDVTGVLTASIIVVGLLGVYWAILAVYLVIAGLSLKWGQRTAPDALVSVEEPA